MKIISFVFVLLLVSTNCLAQTYTGRAENVQKNDRGIAFTVVIEDEEKEVLRRDQWVSTGVMTGNDAIKAIKNVVDRMTMEMYAHLEGAKDALTKKAEIEIYRTTCDRFVPPEDRPSPQDVRID